MFCLSLWISSTSYKLHKNHARIPTVADFSSTSLYKHPESCQPTQRSERLQGSTHILPVHSTWPNRIHRPICDGKIHVLAHVLLLVTILPAQVTPTSIPNRSHSEEKGVEEEKLFVHSCNESQHELKAKKCVLPWLVTRSGVVVPLLHRSLPVRPSVARGLQCRWHLTIAPAEPPHEAITQKKCVFDSLAGRQDAI